MREVELCCPLCKGDLVEEPGEKLCCVPCGRSYPILLGIPDLRVFPDPYIDFAADRAKGLELAQHFDQFTFAELVAYYYQHTPVVPAQHAQMYTRGLLAGADRSQKALAAWEQATGADQPDRSYALLEIGCGTGPLLLAARSRYDTVVGVDIAFRWLVMAKKRLDEAQVSLPLVCACAEALPFRNQTFATVAAESVLEHVQDQPVVLAESHRVLQADGRFYVATPNRYSLGPDPHTGIWAGGMLPQRWVAQQVRKQGGLPPRRNLLSARTLRRQLLAAGFAEPSLWLPAITAEQRALVSRRMQRFIDLYMVLRQLPLNRQLLLWIGPLLYGATRKVDAG